jgi:hypothetical protein
VDLDVEVHLCNQFNLDSASFVRELIFKTRNILLLFSVVSKKAVLWTGMIFPDPDLTFYLVSDPDPILFRIHMNSNILKINFTLYSRLVNALGCIL